MNPAETDLRAKIEADIASEREGAARAWLFRERREKQAKAPVTVPFCSAIFLTETARNAYARRLAAVGFRFALAAQPGRGEFACYNAGLFFGVAVEQTVGGTFEEETPW